MVWPQGKELFAITWLVMKFSRSLPELNGMRKRGGLQHFMKKKMHEQPKTVQDAINSATEEWKRGIISLVD